MKKFDLNKDKLDYNFEYNLEETKNLKKRFSEARKNKNISLDDLRRVSLWKINRILNVSEDLLEKLNYLGKDESLTIDKKETKYILEELTNSKGIGFPMASAILKFIRPDIFPIIDVRAYRALFGKKIYSSQYSFDIYYDYTKKIYSIKNKLKIPLYKIDEQLYEFDKKFNGKI